jgi:hypothetical protein
VTADRPGSSARLAAVAAVSGLYDIALGMTLLFGRPWLERTLGVPPPVPAVHADLNGLFALSIGIGYVLPYRRPGAWRAYLWLMGPFLKGLGAAVLIADHLLRGSPASFLIFAACDATLAAWTAIVLSGRDEQA